MAKVVMAFGSFDILHLGHIHYLERAKRLGDTLIVVISRDSSIEKFKHRKPIFDEKSRLRMVKSLKIVDKVVLGNKVLTKDAMFKVLKKYKPDVIALGYDQMFDEEKLKMWLRKNKIDAEIVRIDTSLDATIYKSSRIRSMIG